MSNRMKVVKYLQTNADFENYQLVILTHDKGFYNILRNGLADDKNTWKWFELYEQNEIFDSNGQYLNPVCLESQDSLVKAKEFLQNHDYEACALYLRKKTEEILRVYFDPSLEELTKFIVFEKLVKMLHAVKKEVNQRLEIDFVKVLKNPHVTEDRLNQLKAVDLESTPVMTSEQQTEVGHTNAFKNDVFNYLTEYYKHNKDKAGKLIEQSQKLDELRARILNVGAHAGDEPLYRQELEEACEAVKEFEEESKRVRNF